MVFSELAFASLAFAFIDFDFVLLTMNGSVGLGQLSLEYLDFFFQRAHTCKSVVSKEVADKVQDLEKKLDKE